MQKNEFAAGCIGCLAICIFGFCGCSGFLAYFGRPAPSVSNKNAPVAILPTSESKPNVADGETRHPELPTAAPAEPKNCEIDYQVIVDQDGPPIKRVVNVHLPHRISEAELKSIALKVHKQSGGRYQRLFIFYTLPGMKAGEGAWATTHFNPDLAINILGSTIETEAKLIEQSTSQADSKDYVGQWKDSDGPSFAVLIRIYRDSGKFYMENRYADEIGNPKELIAFLDSGFVRFVTRGELDGYLRRLNDAEYWEVQANGNLAVCGIESGAAFHYPAIPLTSSANPKDIHNLELKDLPTIAKVRSDYALKPLDPILSNYSRTTLAELCNEMESLMNDLAAARTKFTRTPRNQETLQAQGVFAREFRQRIDNAKQLIATFDSKSASPNINTRLYLAFVELIGAFDWLSLTTKDTDYAEAATRQQLKLQAIRDELARHEQTGGEHSQFRNWTSADGMFRTDAKFISMLNGRVRLEKSNGVRIEIDVGTLSEADQQFLRSRSRGAK